MDSLHYEVDEVLQNKVVELAKEKLEWLKDFKQKNGGVDINLDDEIEFQMEQMEDYISEYSKRKINEKCCNRAVKELSKDLYYEMITHTMNKLFRIALSNKVNKHEYKKRGYDARAVVPYFTVDGHANIFEYSFSTKYIYGVAGYINEDGEDAMCHVDLSIDDLKDFNGERWRYRLPILEDDRICFLLYRKDKRYYNRIEEIKMIWDIDENKAIEKLSSLLKSLKDDKYKIYVSYKGDVMYIYFDIKDRKFNKFVLESNDYHKEIGNRLINKIKEGVK